MAEIIENVKSNMVIRGDETIKAEHFRLCVESYLRQVSLSKTKYTLSKENDSCWCIEKKIYGCCLF
jgi:hypothetical protein